MREVINEVNVDDGRGFRGYVGDSMTTANIRTRMTFSPDIQSINYTVDTVGGVVYLMGVAQDDQSHASTPRRKPISEHCCTAPRQSPV